MSEKYPIKPEWIKYYKALEAIRRSGVVNMFGASPVLNDLYPELSRKESSEILCNWMENYHALSEQYGWR